MQDNSQLSMSGHPHQYSSHLDASGSGAEHLQQHQSGHEHHVHNDTSDHESKSEQYGEFKVRQFIGCKLVPRATFFSGIKHARYKINIIYVCNIIGDILLMLVMLIGRRFCLSLGQLYKSVKFYGEVWNSSRIGATRR